MAVQLPPIATLPSLPDEVLTATLDLLFEPSPALHALILPMLRDPLSQSSSSISTHAVAFTSYGDFIGKVRTQLLSLAAQAHTNANTGTETNTHPPEAGDGSGDRDREGEEDRGKEKEQRDSREKLHSILGSHPRLGEPKKETLSEQSRAEQRRLQEEGGKETAEKLARLNREYEDRFPGLRYVVFVNGRGREEIMRDMERRIARGNMRAEEREAVEVSYLLPRGKAVVR